MLSVLLTTDAFDHIPALIDSPVVNHDSLCSFTRRSLPTLHKTACSIDNVSYMYPAMFDR